MSKPALLPTEVVSMILTALGDIDLKTLIVARAVSSQFHDLIETIAFCTRHLQPTESGELEFDPFLRAEFASIVNKLDPKLRIDGEGPVESELHRLSAMLRDLPWAQTEASREPYLRPGASWRRLCVTVGGPPITDLVCVKLKSEDVPSLGTWTIPNYCEVLMSSPWLTMGLLYDVLLMYHFGDHIFQERRNLFFGQRVADWNLAEYLCRTTRWSTITHKDLASCYAKDAASRQSAVLQINMSKYSGNYEGFIAMGKLWYPFPHGEDLVGLRCCKCQGPLPESVPQPEPLSEDDDL
ncbi:uncharacterized protein PG998_010625 [Apiospora kogelbergensis]|uniref:F-box domain-containing protein n=1 Tax=Apiospora kogelbergensis TaxID=1337665 RepID=A0AAW0RDV3_9PEZI